MLAVSFAILVSLLLQPSAAPAQAPLSRPRLPISIHILRLARLYTFTQVRVDSAVRDSQELYRMANLDDRWTAFVSGCRSRAPGRIPKLSPRFGWSKGRSDLGRPSNCSGWDSQHQSGPVPT